MHPLSAGALRVLVVGFAFAFLSGAAAAAEYTIDQSHSFIQFRISHLGFSILNGRFDDFSGTFSWAQDAPGDSSITVDVKTASIDTNWAERDKHVRSNEFLDVEKYPTATFKSTNYTGDANGGKLEGTLTLHGVTKAVTLDVRAVGEGDDPLGGYRAGFRATTSIDRTDFGISYNLWPIANTMEFELFIEGIRQ